MSAGITAFCLLPAACCLLNLSNLRNRWMNLLRVAGASNRMPAGNWSHRLVLLEDNMNAKTIVLTLALCFVAAVVCFASDLHMGTWKLNEAKSKLAPGAGKNNTVVYEAAGDNVKVTVDGVDRDGKPTHNEWTGKFDGKDYPVTGDPTSDMRSYKVVNDHTMDLTIKKGGKVTV